MPVVRRSREFNVSADQVWEKIGDFHGLYTWLRGVKTEPVEGGTARRAIAGDIVITEHLVAQGERTYSYAMDNIDQNPMRDYRSTLSVRPTGETSCAVDWEGEFVTEGPEQEWITYLEKFYDRGLEGIQV